MPDSYSLRIYTQKGYRTSRIRQGAYPKGRIYKQNPLQGFMQHRDWTPIAVKRARTNLAWTEYPMKR
jgi:hypothetical protein